MRRNEVIAVLLVLLFTIGTVLAALAFESYRKGRAYDIELIARAPENGSWYPGELRIPYGKETKLLIRNIDTVTHGFAVPEMNTGISEIKPGTAKVITLKPERRGTFPFMCTVWCSTRHMEMRGFITVE